MAINYEQWCKNNSDIKPLIRAMKSSLPEQYIGFYLNKIFQNDIEYQKQFSWLSNLSLDFYIPSIKLSIEYDGIYFHTKKQNNDNKKSALCKTNKINIIRLKEHDSDTINIKSNKNEIYYVVEKNYNNIDIAITALLEMINKQYNLQKQITVDIVRDKNEILSYVQYKYHKRTVAYIWPESNLYWDYKKNEESNFDIFTTDNRCFALKCPHCNKNFDFHMKYFNKRKSLIPCECEYSKINQSLEAAIKNYKENGTLFSFDDSLQSRRLYDAIKSKTKYTSLINSDIELEMYKKLGF